MIDDRRLKLDQNKFVNTQISYETFVIHFNSNVINVSDDLMEIETQLDGKEIDRKQKCDNKNEDIDGGEDENDRIFMVLAIPLLEIVILMSVKHIEHWR